MIKRIYFSTILLFLLLLGSIVILVLNQGFFYNSFEKMTAVELDQIDQYELNFYKKFPGLNVGIVSTDDFQKFSIDYKGVNYTYYSSTNNLEFITFGYLLILFFVAQSTIAYFIHFRKNYANSDFIKLMAVLFFEFTLSLLIVFGSLSAASRIIWIDELSLVVILVNFFLNFILFYLIASRANSLSSFQDFNYFFVGSLNFILKLAFPVFLFSMITFLLIDNYQPSIVMLASLLSLLFINFFLVELTNYQIFVSEEIRKKLNDSEKKRKTQKKERNKKIVNSKKVTRRTKRKTRR